MIIIKIIDMNQGWRGIVAWDFMLNGWLQCVETMKFNQVPVKIAGL